MLPDAIRCQDNRPRPRTNIDSYAAACADFSQALFQEKTRAVHIGALARTVDRSILLSVLLTRQNGSASVPRALRPTFALCTDSTWAFKLDSFAGAGVPSRRRQQHHIYVSKPSYGSTPQRSFHKACEAHTLVAIKLATRLFPLSHGE